MILQASSSAAVAEYFGLGLIRLACSDFGWQAELGDPIAPAVAAMGADGALEALIGPFEAVELFDGSCATAGRQPNKNIVLARLNRATDARGNFLTAFCIVISFCKDRAIAAARVIVLGDLLQAAKKRWPSAGEDYSLEEKRR
jgi:hypothetical protein